MSERVVGFGCDGVGQLLIGEIAMQAHRIIADGLGLGSGLVNCTRDRIYSPARMAMRTAISSTTTAVAMMVGLLKHRGMARGDIRIRLDEDGRLPHRGVERAQRVAHLPPDPDQRRRDDGADDALPAAASCDQRCERHQHQHRIIGKINMTAQQIQNTGSGCLSRKQQEREREGQ